MSKSATMCRALQQYDQDELLHIVASLFPEQVQVLLGGTEPKTVLMLARHLHAIKEAAVSAVFTAYWLRTCMLVHARLGSRVILPTRSDNIVGYSKSPPLNASSCHLHASQRASTPFLTTKHCLWRLKMDKTTPKFMQSYLSLDAESTSEYLSSLMVISKQTFCTYRNPFFDHSGHQSSNAHCGV